MQVRHFWAAAALAVLAASSQVAAQAQTQAGAPPNPLSAIKRLKCDFPVLSSGTWENGEPNAQVRKSGVLSFQFAEVDTTAPVVVSSLRAATSPTAAWFPRATSGRPPALPASGD
jgi:hypothetical protein